MSTVLSPCAGRLRPRLTSTSSPAAGATFLIDPTLKPEFQALPLRARNAIGRVDWFVDEQPVGASLGDSPLGWPLVRGAHTITARDADGRTAGARIFVK